MPQVLIVVLIYIGAIILSSLLFIALILSAFYIKKHIHHMNEEKWDTYFKSMRLSIMLRKAFLLYLIAILILAIGCFYLFKALHYEYAYILSVMLVGIGCLYFLFTFKKEKEILIQKLSRLYE